MKIVKVLALFAVLLFLSSNLGLAYASKTSVTLSNKPTSHDWSVLSPPWTYVNGKLDGSGVSTLSPKIISSGIFPSDRTFSVKFRTVIQGSVDYYSAWLVGKYVSEYNRTVIILHNSGLLEMVVSTLGTTGIVRNFYTTQTTLSNLDFHTLTVVYIGDNIRVSTDGVLYFNVNDNMVASLGASHIELASWGNSESQFSSITVSV